MTGGVSHVKAQIAPVITLTRKEKLKSLRRNTQETQVAAKSGSTVQRVQSEIVTQCLRREILFHHAIGSIEILCRGE